MRFLGAVLRSINDGTPVRLLKPNVTRTISTNITSGDDINEDGRANSFESADEFESRIFGGLSGSGSKDVAFFQKLGRAEKAHERTSWDFNWNRENRSETSDGLDDSFSTLSDGMDGKLEKAATYFEFDPDEVEKEDYSFRPDMKFRWGATYDTKDLDLTKPGVSKFTKRQEFEVTTEEVLRKADFRNVRFLANFITDAGIIIKRSKTGISAKAQRKIVREIKTARAFGLMPFTTMGTKSFVYGKTMEPRDEDYEYEVFAGPGNADPEGN